MGLGKSVACSDLSFSTTTVTTRARMKQGEELGEHCSPDKS